MDETQEGYLPLSGGTMSGTVSWNGESVGIESTVHVDNTGVDIYQAQFLAGGGPDTEIYTEVNLNIGAAKGNDFDGKAHIYSTNSEIAIENVTTPTTDDMAANKKYVDDVAASLPSQEDLDGLERIKIDGSEFKLPQSIGGLAYGNDKFVAGGARGCYSLDGINWTQATRMFGNCRLMVYGDNKFVVMNTTQYFYSTDGITWSTPYALPVSSAYSYCGVYGGDKFVVLTQLSDIALYSTDGITWNQTELPASTYWMSVAYGNGRFVALGSNPAKVIWSTDGITWNDSGFYDTNSWKTIAYGANKFVAVSLKTSMYSTDGITWYNNGTLPAESYTYAQLIYSDDKFVLVCKTCALYSIDGITWNQGAIDNNVTWAHLAYGNGRFIAVGNNSTTIAISTDGINWSTSAQYLSDQTNTDVTQDVKSILGITGDSVSIDDVNNAISEATDGKYLPLSGGTLTGPIVLNNEGTSISSPGNATGSDVRSRIEMSDSYLYINALTLTQSSNFGLNTEDSNTGDSERSVLSARNNGSTVYLGIFKNLSSNELYTRIDQLRDPTVDTDAANKRYVDTTVQSALPTQTLITLSSASWTSNTQTITVSGISADEAAQIIQPVPTIASQSAYVDAGIMCTGQAANSLTFTCKTTPTADLSVYIVVQNVRANT